MIGSGWISFKSYSFGACFLLLGGSGLVSGFFLTLIF